MHAVAHRAIRIAAVTAMIATIGVGCGVQQVAEQVGEQALDGEVELEDDSISIADDEGNEFAAGSGTEIPESWPADVPLFTSGVLVLATSQSDGAAAALWQTTESVDVAAAEYDSVLISQGFSLERESVVAGAVVRTYSNAVYTVNVAVAPSIGSGEEQTSVNATVVPK